MTFVASNARFSQWNTEQLKHFSLEIAANGKIINWQVKKKTDRLFVSNVCRRCRTLFKRFWGCVSAVWVLGKIICANSSRPSIISIHHYKCCLSSSVAVVQLTKLFPFRTNFSHHILSIVSVFTRDRNRASLGLFLNTPRMAWNP